MAVKNRLYYLQKMSYLNDNYCDHCPFKSNTSGEKCETCPISRQLKEVGDNLLGGDFKKTAGRKGKVWTAEEDQVIIEGYTTKRQPDVAEFLGVPYATLKNRIKKLRELGKITPSMKPYYPKREKKEKIKLPRKNGWTPEQEKVLIDNYRILEYQVMADMVGKSRGSVSTKIRQLKDRGEIDE